MRVGDVLDGRYELQEKLGQGGFGVVWRAEDTRMHRPVAVKLIRHDDGDQAKAALRFAREASAAGNLSHPHIVTVYDLGHGEAEGEDVTFLVMELLAGRTLTAVLREGVPAPALSLRWAREIGEALAAAHDAGVVHRDIKPDNVMIAGDGHLKVLDFGIAQLDTGAGGLTTVGTVIGSPPYMAPERWTGGRVDGRADLYALGCLLVELLTGARPFNGDSTPVLMYQHLNEPPPALDPARYGLPEHLPALVAELLAKDPAERPADARAVTGRLADLAEGRPVPRPLRSTTRARTAPLAPARRRGQAGYVREPKLRPVGRAPLVLDEPARPDRADRAGLPQGPVEDRAVLRARLLEAGPAVPAEDPAEVARRLGAAIDGGLPVLGPADPDVVAARRELAAQLGRAGRAAEAVRELRELADDLRSAFGPTDSRTLEARYEVTRLVREGGEPVTAIRLLTELLPVLRLAWGPHGPLVLQAWHDLAACLARRGDFHGAVLQLTELLPQLVTAFGEQDERTARARADLADCRQRTRAHRSANEVVRGWRMRLDRVEAERLVRQVRAGGEPGRAAARALRRGTGVKGVVDRVVAAPGFVSDADLVEEVFGPQEP
ncbi:protein kinase domain-containing protein [Kitasatospora sp. NPDC094028]